MSEANSCTALVVGAGPVGLTMAAHLLRHGIGFRIIDKAPAPSDKSKALAIWGRTLEMLEGMGLVDAFTSAGVFLNGLRTYSNDQLLLHLKLNATGTAYSRPLLLAQSETERLLTEHLQRAGMTVERAVELTDIRDTGNEVAAFLRHADGREEQVRCDWLLGCDGAHSVARKKLGLEFAGAAEPNDFILADCRVDGPLPMDEITGFWHSDGVVGFFPFKPSRWRIIADMGAAKGMERPADPSLADVQAIVDQRCPTGIRLSEPHWLAGFRIHERKVADYRRGRVFLCGDAAHIHSPAGGQGMNTGMQDAWNLSWKLALVHSGKAKPALLDSYTPERSPVGELVLRQAARMTSLITLRNPVARFLRNQGLRLLGRIPAFQRDFVRYLAEMAIHYPKSPLNGESTRADWKGGKVKPGDRFPDVRLRDPKTGRDERMLRILHGTGYDLVLLPSVADAATLSDFRSIQQQVAAAYGELIRTHLIVPSGALLTGLDGFDSAWLDSGELRKKLGARQPALALIRPDGYLAFRGQPASWDMLRAYLERFLVGKPA